MAALTVHAALLTLSRIFRFHIDLHIVVLDLIYLYGAPFVLVVGVGGTGFLMLVNIRVEAYFVSFL